MAEPVTAERTMGLTPPLAHSSVRVLLGVFALLHLALAVSGSPSGLGPADVLGLVLIVAAGTVVVLVPGGALTARWTLLVLVALLIACGMKDQALPVGGWPGYAAWHLGATTFVLLALTLRGRIGAAWLGMAGVAIESVAWSITTGQGVYHGVDLVDRQAGTLLIGTLFAVGLARASTAVAELRALEHDRVTEQRGVSASHHARAEEATRLLALLGATLTALETAERLPIDERASLRALEGGLRDRMLAPELQDETLETALAKARRRGVDVALLSDLDPERPHPRLREALAWLSDRADAVESGGFVGRVTSQDGAIRISAYSDQDHHEELFPESS